MKTKTRVILLIAAAAMLLALSACGKSYETKQAELPDYYPGTYVYFEYQEDTSSDELWSMEMETGPQKDADGNDILEFTIKQDGTLVINGKEYATRYEVLAEAPELPGSLSSEDGYYNVDVYSAGQAEDGTILGEEFEAALSQAAGGYVAGIGVNGIEDEETGESFGFYYSDALYIKQ